MSKNLSEFSPLVWMDLEMTGLDPDKDEIIEIAVVITDANLKLVATGPELVLNQPRDRFAKMDQWNQEHHTKTGLWDRVVTSTVSCRDAEDQVLEFLQKHVELRKSPLCGNSIWQDRRFLIRHMPRVDAYLHYRMIDVSTIKELAARWYPPIAKGFIKENKHRALDDILESINELRYYRKSIFLPSGEGEA